MRKRQRKYLAVVQLEKKACFFVFAALFYNVDDAKVAKKAITQANRLEHWKLNSFANMAVKIDIDGLKI